jgi:hypothetical protein
MNTFAGNVVSTVQNLLYNLNYKVPLGSKLEATDSYNMQRLVIKTKLGYPL